MCVCIVGSQEVPWWTENHAGPYDYIRQDRPTPFWRLHVHGREFRGQPGQGRHQSRSHLWVFLLFFSFFKLFFFPYWTICFRFTTDRPTAELRLTFFLFLCAGPNYLLKQMMIDEPEIEVELNLVTIAEGYNTELTCTVHGEPKPNVFWSKNGERLDSATGPNTPHHRYVQTSTGSRHVLSIDNVQSHDFANYTCHGENRFGRDHKTIEMTGIILTTRHHLSVDSSRK